MGMFEVAKLGNESGSNLSVPSVQSGSVIGRAAEYVLEAAECRWLDELQLPAREIFRAEVGQETSGHLRQHDEVQFQGAHAFRISNFCAPPSQMPGLARQGGHRVPASRAFDSGAFAKHDHCLLRQRAHSGTEVLDVVGASWPPGHTSGQVRSSGNLAPPRDLEQGGEVPHPAQVGGPRRERFLRGQLLADPVVGDGDLRAPQVFCRGSQPGGSGFDFIEGSCSSSVTFFGP